MLAPSSNASILPADPASTSINCPTVSLTERGHRLLALLACREILLPSSTMVAAVLDRRIAGLLDGPDAA